MEEYLQIGVITTTHGVRGEVKVYPTTDPERFLSLDRVFLDTGKEKKELHVTGVRFFKQLAIVKFKGIDNINDIERYKGCSLYVTREDAIPLEEDETYSVDTGYYTVHIEVKDGRARFIESPCPDHICEGFGWLSAEDQTATCLPARAVLTIVPVD